MSFKPDDVSRVDPLKEIGDEHKINTPTSTPGKSFEEFMQKAGQQPEVKTSGNLSPFELSQGKTPLAAGATFDSLMTQVKQAQTTLGDINNGLNTKNLKLKQSQRYLLKNKLTDANAHIRAANAKMGAETPPPAAPQASGGGIIGKFLDYVSEGQSNLMAAQQQILNLKGKGDSLKPADFLAIQLKLGHAQQEIEFASIMLSKAVDDLKMIFNIQL